MSCFYGCHLHRQRVSRRDERAGEFGVLLVVLGAAWGSSYLFIKVAVSDIAPAPTMCARLLLAALLLGVVVVSRRGLRSVLSALWTARRSILVLGPVNLAIPTWLIAWGEQHIDSGTAGIAQASVPVFVVVLGLRFLPQEPVSVGRLSGITIGLGGVLLLVGGHAEHGAAAALGVAAVVASSLSYAAAAIYIRKRVVQLDGPVLVLGELLVGGAVLLPFALIQLPGRTPSWPAITSVAALAVVGTLLAQLLLFRILLLGAAARVSLVTYLIPAFALAYGWLFLGERISAVSVGGLACILTGVAVAARPSSSGRPDTPVDPCRAGR